MTFADWYAANVKPQLEETLKTMPVAAREALRNASRQAFAECWNAALDAAGEMLDKPNPHPETVYFKELRA